MCVTMKLLTPIQLASIKQDILLICQNFNSFRTNISDYLRLQGLDPKDKTLDPFYLYEGGANLTKQFNKDWTLAAKVAKAKSQISVMEYAANEQRGFNLQLFGEKVEEVSRAFHYIPGIAIPNKWTGNKFSQTKPQTTLLLSFACNFDGSIKQLWAAIVSLTSHPDGQSGDWKFSDCDKAGFSSLTLTQDVFDRPSFQQVLGDLEYDYIVGGDAKKGMKMVMVKLPTTEVIIPTAKVLA